MEYQTFCEAIKAIVKENLTSLNTYDKSRTIKRNYVNTLLRKNKK